jgi:Zn-dependent protease
VNRRQSIAWQILGGFVALIVIAGTIGELIWWPLYLSDHTNVTPFFTWIVHITMAIAVAALLAYWLTRKKRDRALREGGPAVMPEDQVWSVRAGAFTIEVQWAFLLFVGLLAAFSGSVPRAAFVVPIAIVSIVAHELGHAFAAKRLGRKDIHIVLHGLGGMTYFAESIPPRAERMAIALAGPAVGVFLGLILLSTGLRGQYFNDALFATLGWSALNLLPIRPLDGSAILDVTWVSLFLSAGGAIASAFVPSVRLLALFFAVLFVVNILTSFPALTLKVRRWNQRIG